MLLSYDAILRIVNQEKSEKKLLQLPENFFTDVKTYVENKSKMMDKKEGWELESARRLVQDLLEIRERKILILALYNVRSGVSSDNFTSEEKKFFDILVENIKTFRNERKIIVEGRPEKKELVVIIDDLDEFVGIDMKTYGPFRRGDLVHLPEENAKLLLGKKMVKKM
ncbi:MAG: hypothetical protein KKC05_03225, partial [Nanoarchaeota archaeon]|nr:hypothetical protein [Nanoarchaeota archaeon]